MPPKRPRQPEAKVPASADPIATSLAAAKAQKLADKENLLGKIQDLVSPILDQLTRLPSTVLAPSTFNSAAFPRSFSHGFHLTIAGEKAPMASLPSIPMFRNQEPLLQMGRLRTVLKEAVAGRKTRLLVPEAVWRSLELPQPSTPLRFPLPPFPAAATLVTVHLSPHTFEACYVNPNAADVWKAVEGWAIVLEVLHQAGPDARRCVLGPAAPAPGADAGRARTARTSDTASSWDSDTTVSSDSDSDDDDEAVGSVDSSDGEDAPAGRVGAEEIPSVSDMRAAGMARGVDTVPVDFDDDRQEVLSTLLPWGAAAPDDVEPMHPTISLFVPTLRQLYEDPISTSSKTFHERNAKQGMPRDTFEKLRVQNLKEKSGPPIQHDPYVSVSRSGKRGRPTRAWTVGRRSIETQFEGFLALHAANGTARECTEEEAKFDITVGYIGDGAGRRIGSIKLAAGSLIAFGYLRHPGALSSVFTAWVHGGPYAAAHRAAIMTSYIGEGLLRISRMVIGGRNVYLVNLSDYGDAPSFYDSASLSPPTTPWALAAQRGHLYFTVHICPCCMYTYDDALAVHGASELPYRAVPPITRYQPALRCPYVPGRMHLITKGLPTLLGLIYHLFTGPRSEDPNASEIVDSVSGFFPDRSWSPSGIEQQPVSSAAGAAAASAASEAQIADKEEDEAGGKLAFGDGPSWTVRPKTLKTAIGEDGEPPKVAKLKELLGDNTIQHDDQDKAIADMIDETIAYTRLAWQPHRHFTSRDKVREARLEGRVAGEWVRALAKVALPLEDPVPLPQWVHHLLLSPADRKALRAKARREKRSASRAAADGGQHDETGDPAPGSVRHAMASAAAAAAAATGTTGTGTGTGTAAGDAAGDAAVAAATAGSAGAGAGSSAGGAGTSSSATASGPVTKDPAASRRQAVFERASRMVQRLPYDASKSPYKVSAHMLYDHGLDVLMDEKIPFDVARNITEEAGDHFFVYLYYTVPAINPREIGTRACVMSVWQVCVEAQMSGTPTSSTQRRAMINRAYT